MFKKKIYAFIFLLVILAFIIAVPMISAQTDQPILPVDFPQQLAVILGVLAPLVIQFVVKNVQYEMARLGIAILLSALIGLVGAILKGLPVEFTLKFITAIFVFGQAAFNVFWKPIVFEGMGILKK